ncbi:MAG: zf-HC2 domain-containing protein [Armatimonadota bacterium]
MSCDWARKLMVLADGLTKEEQVDLEAHLSQCPLCAEEWKRWQKLFALLSQLPSISSTPEERTQLMHSLSYVPQVPELSCSMAKSFIWRWLDSDLSEREKASLVAHLANCDKCQGFLWQAEQMSYMLRSLPRLKATAAEKEALKARLKRTSKRPTLIPFVWRVAFPVAAAAVLMLAVLAKLQSPTRDQTTLLQSGREGTVAPSIAVTQPTRPEQPKVVKQTERTEPKVRQPEVRRPQVLAQSQQPTVEPKRIQTATKQPVEKLQIAKSPEPRRTEKLAIPEPPETIAPVQTAPELTVKPEAQETVVAESPKVVVPATVTAPIPSRTYEGTSVPTLSPQTLPSQPVQESPAMASLSSETRQLVALPPVTIESDLDLQPPRVKLTVVPPSQRLYQKSGVALVTVPPEKRPLKVSEEQALVPDLSIPLAAERYRSHTATIPFFRFGVSW